MEPVKKMRAAGSGVLPVAIGERGCPVPVVYSSVGGSGKLLTRRIGRLTTLNHIDAGKDCEIAAANAEIATAPPANWPAVSAR